MLGTCINAVTILLIMTVLIKANDLLHIALNSRVSGGRVSGGRARRVTSVKWAKTDT